MVEPVEKQLGVLDDDQRLDDHHLEELLYETLFDLNWNFFFFWKLIYVRTCPNTPSD
jgi:hypothetical protein